MRFPLLGNAIDERFMMHRLRSTSLGGIAGGSLALLLFLYHYTHEHVLRLDLFAVGATVVVVKLAALLWYRLTD
jgi:hypothetical protein